MKEREIDTRVLRDWEQNIADHQIFGSSLNDKKTKMFIKVRIYFYFSTKLPQITQMNILYLSAYILEHELRENH